MTDASETPLKIELGASAKVSLEIKTEIPSGSMGRLTDAITNLLSPWSEARALKADLIRLHREEVAFEIAKRAARRLTFEQATQQSIPLKVLVPLLEKGSQEDVKDDYMINMWANLLASTALQPSVSPQLVAILSEMSAREARLLAAMAGKRADYGTSFVTMNYPSSSKLLQHLLSKEIQPHQLADCLLWRFEPTGTYLHHLQVVLKQKATTEKHPCWHDPSITSVHFEDLEVLTSLGLLRKVEIEQFPDNEIIWCVRLSYYVMTHLAVYLLNTVMPELYISFSRYGDHDGISAPPREG